MDEKTRGIADGQMAKGQRHSRRAAILAKLSLEERSAEMKRRKAKRKKKRSDRPSSFGYCAFVGPMINMPRTCEECGKMVNSTSRLRRRL